MRKLKHKPKEPVETPRHDAVPPSSGVFTTLFGDVPKQNAASVSSIFSDDNPYRRKPLESSTPGLGFPQAESLRRTDDDGRSESPNLSDELNKKKKKDKRKRDKEKTPENPILESDPVAGASGTALGTKKSKKEKPQNLNIGNGSNGALEDGKDGNPKLGSESNGASEKERGKPAELGPHTNEEDPDLDSKASGSLNNMNKKKRKRDELEREYEARKYGAAEVEEREEAEGGSKEKKKIVGEKRKTVDNVEDMVVSPDGFDDESKLLRTVFVGNLPLKVKKKALTKEFKQFGEVESVRIRSVPIVDTKKPRKGAIITKQFNEAVDSVHAYIVFKSEESAQASLTHNMAVFGGNHIRVDRACPPRKKLKGENGSFYDIKRTVFVGNLPYDVKDEQLYQLFSGIDNLGSSIEAVRVIRHSHISLGKGIAYVLFKTREAANLVVKKRNLKLQDRELRISHARRDSTPSSTPTKRPYSSPSQPANSPAKRLALDRTTSEGNNRANTKAPLSYQGLRASKSGVQKKAHPKSIRSFNMNSNNQKGEKLKEQKGKRPAVAARKVQALAQAFKVGGSTAQGGVKRKPDSQTPESFKRKNKKFKKSK
ncbi:RNA-binding protein 34 [Juglans microcarpa x Juglans regia]|uniref:RNA-binding protein 34 n=1 Tax=Juglans microcarpa x Juglans regia TaxID=2249226 RepID=UPI001B7DA3B4|nr:RNA-binding protein 34 [Juglans microcarpa x Juglans regia]